MIGTNIAVHKANKAKMQKLLTAKYFALEDYFSDNKEMKPISPELIQAFQRDGVVCLRNAFDKKWLDTISKDIVSS